LYSLVHQLQKYDWGKIKKTCHVTLITPLLGVVCHRRLGFDTVYLRANFDDSSLSRSKDIIEASKLAKVGHSYGQDSLTKTQVQRSEIG